MERIPGCSLVRVHDRDDGHTEVAGDSHKSLECRPHGPVIVRVDALQKGREWIDGDELGIRNLVEAAGELVQRVLQPLVIENVNAMKVSPCGLETRSKCVGGVIFAGEHQDHDTDTGSPP